MLDIGLGGEIRLAESAAAGDEESRAASMGEEAVVADANEALRKDVQQEADLVLPRADHAAREAALRLPVREIARIVEIWSERRGPFLFGAFSGADAMYAPVVLRFRTYEVELPSACRAYADAVLALPALQEWIADAGREAESLPQFEQYA